jgi:hypothetical protein
VTPQHFQPGGFTFRPDYNYNGFKLARKEVESVRCWERGDGWDEALKAAEAWLVYRCIVYQ